MKKFILAVILSLICGMAAANDRVIGLRIMFNEAGMQGIGPYLRMDKVVMHGSLLKDREYVVGIGYRWADTQDSGMSGDKLRSIHSDAGFAVMGGNMRGKFHPFIELGGDMDIADQTNAEIGLIHYGFGGLTGNATYGYAGINEERLEDDIVTDTNTNTDTDTNVVELTSTTSSNNSGPSSDNDSGNDDEDHDRGHGNNDGLDPDNPGQGHGYGLYQ